MIINKEGYSSEFYDLLNIIHWKDTESKLLSLTNSLNENGTYLDIGSGTGNLSIFIANKFEKARIVAIEPSVEMRIAMMAKICRCNSFRKRITIIPMEISEYNIKDEFDGCFLMDTIGHLSDFNRKKLWETLSKKLKENSPLLITNTPDNFKTFSIGKIGSSSIGDNIIKIYIDKKNMLGDNFVEIEFRIDLEDKRDREIIYSNRYIVKWRILGTNTIIEELRNFNFNAREIYPNWILAFPMQIENL